jgi:hypothetical protein
VAAAQDGLFSAAQASAAGLTKAEIAARVRSGAWHRVVRSVYVEQPLWAAMDDRQRHLATAGARLLVLRPGWAVARRSAVLAHDLPYLGKPPQTPQLLRDHGSGGPRVRATSRHERIAALPQQDLRRLGGLLVCSLERTALDLARSETFVSAVVVADAALRRGVEPASLTAVARRCAGWPGGLRALRVAEFADGLSESPLESMSRVAIAACGLPAPELQIEVWVEQRCVARVDKLWRGCNLVGEDDGRSKYVDPGVLYAEKLREEALEDLGLEVVRWDWDAALRDHRRLEAKIRRGMEQGARKVLDPRVRFVPTTVPLPVRRTG